MKVLYGGVIETNYDLNHDVIKPLLEVATAFKHYFNKMIIRFLITKDVTDENGDTHYLIEAYADGVRYLKKEYVATHTENINFAAQMELVATKEMVKEVAHTLYINGVSKTIEIIKENNLTF